MDSFLTLYVTYSDPRASTPSLNVSYSGDPNNPLTFVVNVPIEPGMTQSAIRTAALLLAAPQYREYLAQTYHWPKSAPPPAPSPVTHLVVTQNEDPQLVFDPSEITPFLDAALQRWVVVAGRGIRVELAGHETASTDCVSVITINPQPLLEGHVADFEGRGLHETSHIRWDRTGTAVDQARRFGDRAAGVELLGRARSEGGEVLKNILNIIMDRRVDWLHAREYPGNALDVWHRLGSLLPGEVHDPETGEVRIRRNGITLDCETSVFTDFVYACKKHTRGRHKVVRKAVHVADRAIKRVNAGTHKYALLLTAAKRVLAILRTHMTEQDHALEDDQRTQERKFNEFMYALGKQESGSAVDPHVQTFFRVLMATRLATQRTRVLAQLPAMFRTASGAGTPPVPPPPSPGTDMDGRQGQVLTIKPNAAAYSVVLPKVQPYVAGLRDILRRLAIPQRRVTRGLTEGEFDLEALPVLASGGPDCMKIERRHAKLDLALACVLDMSGSMNGNPVETAKGLGVCFNEAILSTPHCVDGFFLAFDHNVYLCGRACPNNGIASVVGGGTTGEAFALRHAAVPVAATQRRRKIIVVVCDGSPDDPKAVKREVNYLMGLGILPIRILIGVDAAPESYPVELLFDNWTEFYQELGKTFGAIFHAARL